jgi:predicted NBD/HSP70 family sugar kinase
MKELITGDYTLVKNLNSQIVLNLIREHGCIYGSDLARITGMRSSTIMNILHNLEKSELIINAGVGASTRQGGRRPTMWEVNGNYGYVIGLKIGLGEIQGVLMDLKRSILAQVRVGASELLDTEQIVGQIYHLVDHLLVSARIKAGKVLGLGIGVSGAVDSDNGVVVKSYMLKNSAIPLRNMLKKRYRFPIHIENDANAGILCEKWFGHSRNDSDMLYVMLVIDKNVFGIGYGLILDDHIYRGAHKVAGESHTHHITIKSVLDLIDDPQESRIRIGSRIFDKEQVQLADLLHAAPAQDAAVVRYFHYLGTLLGEELVTIVDLLDPQLILLSGEVTKAGELLLQPLQNALKTKSILGEVRDTMIEMATPQPADQVAMGAASLVLQDVFHNPVIRDMPVRKR